MLWCAMAIDAADQQTLPSDPVEDFEARVYVKRIRQAYEHTVGNRLRTLMATLFIGLVLWFAQVSNQVLVFWVAFSLATNIAVLTLELRFRDVDLDVIKARRWARLRLFFGGLAASPYGLSIFLLPPDSSTVYELLIFIIVSTSVSISAIGFPTLPSLYLTVNFLTMGLLTLRFLSQWDQIHLFIAAMAIVWQITVVRKAWEISQTVIDGIRTNEQLEQEISQHEITKGKLSHMAFHDPLTDIANRRLFIEFAKNRFMNAARTGSQAGVLLIDLDNFKPINDQYGHHVGDLVLQEVAKRLKDVMRGGDIAARIGGDEFSVLASEVEGRDGADQLAERIEACILAPMVINDITHKVSASIGVALFPDDGQELDEILKRADTNMYSVKSEKKLSA